MGRVRESEDRLHMEGCDGDTVSKVQKKSLLPQEANTFLILQGVFFDYYPKKWLKIKYKQINEGFFRLQWWPHRPEEKG